MVFNASDNEIINLLLLKILYASSRSLHLLLIGICFMQIKRLKATKYDSWGAILA